jgi:hypothetical protein
LIAGAAVAMMAAACDYASSITSPEAAYPKPAFDLESVTDDAAGESVIDDAAGTTELDLPWVVTETNPCNGDEVATQGKTHVVFNSTLDASGGTHNSFKISWSGSGVGVPSMSNYRVTDKTTQSIQDPDGPQVSYQEEHQLVLAAPKPALSYIRHVLIKFTFNGRGVPTAAIDNLFTKCGGETQLEL